MSNEPLKNEREHSWSKNCSANKASPITTSAHKNLEPQGDQIIFKLIGIQDCILFSLDSYYKVLSPEQYANLSEYNFDHPNAFDFDLVVKHLNDLLDLKEIEMPVYNFTVSKRESHTVTLKPSNLIIFDFQLIQVTIYNKFTYYYFLVPSCIKFQLKTFLKIHCK